ncbi:DNA replication licensing factor [Phytophthora megakarya]|uniref:DNA replication licensing factor n=1 Tax=Phytophthora megakarya TaxID=4795 RepID=A0A225X186_9STRA|nr:DNA replication licensing factor [Phytophthora megakarya]
MGLDIRTMIQEKTRWMASKLSLRNLRSKKRSRAAMETTELRPVALAGASRGFTGSSTQCNHFSRTPSGAYHEQWTDSSGGGNVLPDSRWKVCRMCHRKFSPLSMSRQYADFCSLDCKSAFMLGPGSLRQSRKLRRGKQLICDNMGDRGGISLLVRNISRRLRPEDIRKEFERYGEVRDVYIPKDYYTKEPKGFAFVEFRSEREADDARRNLDGVRIDGRDIRVVFAQERRKSTEQMRDRERCEFKAVC